MNAADDHLPAPSRRMPGPFETGKAIVCSIVTGIVNVVNFADASWLVNRGTVKVP